MKKGLFALLFTLVFLFLTNCAIAQKTVEMVNGEDWNNFNEGTRIAFVSGFMSGSNWVSSNSLVPKTIFGDTPTFERAKELWGIITNEIGNQTPINLKEKYSAHDVLLFTMYDGYKKNSSYEKAIFKVLNSSIVLELNKFYSDSKNSVVLISNAIFLVYKKLRGAPKDDIETLLPYLRGKKPIPAGWIIPVYDKNGKFIRFVEFP